MGQSTWYELRLVDTDELVGKFIAQGQRLDDFATAYIADNIERPSGGDEEPERAAHPGQALNCLRIRDLGEDERERTHLYTYELDGTVTHTPAWEAERETSRQAQVARMAEIRAAIDGQAAAKLEGIKAVTREVVADLREVLSATE